MKIVFIHYHLKTGGVTTVIRQQIDAIQDDCEVLVVTGDKPPEDFPCETVYIPAIGYDIDGNSRQNPEETAQIIFDAISAKWQGGCDVLHAHNPTLAKNRHFLHILKHLQAMGVNLFLQVHDFAEDGRPASYFSETYPENCHYGVINSRDYTILVQSGLKEEGLHKIENTIRFFDSTPKDVKRENFVLYPIRALRRKNIGEAILLTLFFIENESLVITLPPNSTRDKKYYEEWRSFVDEYQLKVIFEAGLKSDFETLVLSSKFIISTSITEGFGFSFLEPWTAGKLLWGRKIPDICNDFENNGVTLDHLYTHLQVPVEWVGGEYLVQKIHHFYQIACDSFNMKSRWDEFERSIQALFKDNLVDFGILDEAFQKKVISCILSDGEKRKKLVDLNPFLSCPGIVKDKEKLIKENFMAIKKEYNKSIYNKKLIDIYTKIVEKKVRHSIDKKHLLLTFLQPKEFHLLKWG